MDWQIASKNGGGEAGRNQVVLGQFVCLPEEIGPDFTGRRWPRSRRRLRAGVCSVNVPDSHWGREEEKLADSVGGERA